MTEYKLVVMSKPVAGRVDDYDDWYENTHLDDVLRIPGVIGAQRFELAYPLSGEPPEARYLAIYDIVSDDIEKTLEPFNTLANTPAMMISDAMDSDIQALLYRASAPKRLPKDAPADAETSAA
jgi:hypothetical protein